MSIPNKNLAIYIHWPFCKFKCHYCDFNSHVAENIDYNIWQESYLKEINYFHDFIKQHNISSIFFGGGTPTLMPPQIAYEIITHLNRITNFTSNIEITLEGNPTSVEAAKLQDFKESGINRVSLGIQALNANDLKFLSREHSADEAINAIKTAQKIFDNYSFDLIYARPSQTLTDWEEELTEALKLADKHVSLYQLTIEKGTKFYSDYNKGAFVMPSEDLSADFYNLTQDIMEKHNLPAYEVSNHAKTDYESKHNLSYWRYDDYLGIGPGAHSRITLENKKHALMMISSPENWLKAIVEKGVGIQTDSILDNDIIQEEIIMMGLRIAEGINKQKFKNLTGKEIELCLNQNKLEYLQNNNLIIIDNNSLRPTKEGMILVNYIVRELLS